jgi:AAA+ ATPase superfamily predicted ATPase
MNILNMEVGQPQVYFTVLELLAHGVNKHIEISDKSGLSPTQASYYLSTLRELGLVTDILPFRERNKKRTRWVIKDGLFLFYFKHVYPYRALIERGRNDGVTAQLKKSFSTHMGKPFEEICKEYLMVHPELMSIEIGSWWGTHLRRMQVHQCPSLLPRIK